MRKQIEEVLRDAVGDAVALDVTVPEHASFGHYSTPVAMRLAKLKGSNPREVAERLVATLKEKAPEGLFEKIEVAEPGFVNFWVLPSAAQEAFSHLYGKRDRFGTSGIGGGKTVIVEYSQPNIAKVMHVGHLRTTVLGNALANVYEALGYKTVRWNYLGDWGTQFGKLIVAYREWGRKEEVERKPLEALTELYVRFHKEAKARPELEERGREEFRRLEEGDSENRKLWEWFHKESVKEMKAIYRTLGVRFDTYAGEAFFEGEMKPLVARLLKDGVARKSEGGVIVPLDDVNLPPALIQKSDGASLYLTRDIANVTYRLKEYRPVKIIYVVGNEQSLHFAQVFAVAKKLGLDSAELVHAKYGLVLDESGRRFSTREGKAIPLQKLLEEAVRRARAVVEEKNPSLSRVEKDEVAHAVGIGAVKYLMLKEHRHSDIVFSWKEMLDLGGDSAPYLQYAHARFASILRKAGGIGEADVRLLDTEHELALMRKIFEFPDTVLKAAESLLTNGLAGYLYGLAKTASRLYESVPVLGDESEERRNARLELIEVAATVLKRGLGLLGIEAPGVI